MTISVARKELNEKKDSKVTRRKDKAKPVDPCSAAVVELLLRMLTTDIPVNKK